MKRVFCSAIIVVLLTGITTVWAHEGHHHSAEAQEEAEGFIDPVLLGFSGLREIVNAHPAFVHFPVALFPSALFLYGLGIVLNWRAASAAGRACLYLAVAGTAVAVITGLAAEGTVPHNERIHHMMETHEHLGYLISGFGALLVGWSFLHTAQRPRGAYAFLAVLACAAYLVLQTGDLGSRMVYVEGAAVGPVLQASHSHEHAH